MDVFPKQLYLFYFAFSFISGTWTGSFSRISRIKRIIKKQVFVYFYLVPHAQWSTSGHVAGNGRLDLQHSRATCLLVPCTVCCHSAEQSSWNWSLIQFPLRSKIPENGATCGIVVVCVSSTKIIFTEVKHLWSIISSPSHTLTLCCPPRPPFSCVDKDRRVSGTQANLYPLLPPPPHVVNEQRWCRSASLGQMGCVSSQRASSSRFLV